VINRTFICCLTIITASLSPVAQAEQATGIVFHDENRNGEYDEGEPGIDGVRISNGREVTRTGEDGRYSISAEAPTVVFVCKPRGWKLPTDENNLPQFFYVHKPQGSPNDQLAHPGSAPTGALPEQINFPLHPREEDGTVTAVIIADPQVKNHEHVEFYARDVMAEVAEQDIDFGITVGDMVHDNLSLFPEVNETQSLAGVPWFNVHGNHDMNTQARSDEHADETFERVYGPTDYAFQFGKAHFIVFDNVNYHGRDEGGYQGDLSREQLNFLDNYLETVPTDHHITLFTHIPLDSPFHGRKDRTPQLDEVLSLLSRFPRTASYAGHQHQNQRYFFGKDRGYQPDGGESHLHHILGAASGDIWDAPRDREGIPQVVNHGGAPNGYVIAEFDGNNFRERWKVARRPRDYQMSFDIPSRVPSNQLADKKIQVNVFNGSERSKVRMKIPAQTKWIEMQKQPQSHVWEGSLPADVSKGPHVLQVQAQDVFGQTHRGRHPLWIE